MKTQVWTHMMVAGLLALSPRAVSSQHGSHFTPLPCNSDFSMPCEPLNIVNITTASVYVVPCGICRVLEESVDFAGGLNVEGHLQILPPIDRESTLSIQAPFVFVQGKLTVDTESLADRLGRIHIELVQGDGKDVILAPHAHNKMACDSAGCNVGKRPFVVAGGQVDIRGYHQSCPSWTNLMDVVKGNMVELDPSQYEQAPQPEVGCSSTVVSQDFEDGIQDAVNAWDGNGAPVHGITVDHYYQVSNRTSGGQGPRVLLANPECLTPGAQYLFSVKIKLSGPTASACSRSGVSYCPRLNLFTTTKQWRRLGVFNGNNIEDGTWGVFQLQATFNADEVGPSSNNPLMALSIEGPELPIDIAVDDFVLELAPAGTYPDPSQVCAQLLPNGDAEQGSGANIFPFTFTGGRASIVTKNGNSFFRQSQRTAFYMRLNAKITTGCVVQAVVYRVSAKVQVHSEVPRQAEIVMGSAQPDGSIDWSVPLLCPASDASSGFVSCETLLSFSPKQIAATDITLFIRPRADDTSMIDWDDLSIEFVDGPVEELLVDPALHDCWADEISKGADVLLTSHTLDFDNHQVVSATGMTTDGKISATSPISNPLSGPDDFSVEVALLSRRITLGASSDNSIGGHFIVLHTPDVIQTIRGLEIKGFGQQGNLGRYPIHFHMSNNVNGSVVSKNVIRDSHQRCIVVHGTNTILVEDNVAYK